MLKITIAVIALLVIIFCTYKIGYHRGMLNNDYKSLYTDSKETFQSMYKESQNVLNNALSFICKQFPGKNYNDFIEVEVTSSSSNSNPTVEEIA